MQKIVRFNERRNAVAFWLGCAVVTAGVVLHLPMFLMGRNTGYVLAGMPMGADMLWGMAAIVFGVVLTGYGLLPRTLPGRASDAGAVVETLAPPEDAPLSRAHWQVALLLALALIIDIMKPASLGFVTPGMSREYEVDRAMVAWLPLAALTGTVIGSFIWGALADVVRATRVDLALIGDVHRHLDLRGDARLLVERVHVLPDGDGSGRHVARRVRIAC